MPTYSFGEDSPMKFQISDKLAERYNDAVKEFFRAQQRFNQKFGRPWNPKTDPIELRWDRKRQKAWDAFGKVMKEVIKRDGPFHENDIMEDYLIKNTVSAAISRIDKGGVMITTAATLGALYVLLRGLQRPSVG